MAEIRQWVERIHMFDSQITTENGLFLVNNARIHETMVPELDAIHIELCSFIIKEAFEMGTEFLAKMTEVVKVSFKS